MDRDEPYSVYYSILSAIQPASIEEIEESVASLLGAQNLSRFVEDGLLRQAHDYACTNRLVIMITDEKYVISERAEAFVRSEGWGKFIDNRRLFTMKAQRREHRRYSQGIAGRQLIVDQGEL